MMTPCTKTDSDVRVDNASGGARHTRPEKSFLCSYKLKSVMIELPGDRETHEHGSLDKPKDITQHCGDGEGQRRLA